MQADIDAVKAILDAHPEADQMTDAELDELKAAKEKLMNSAQQVFQKMYEQAQAAQGAAGAGAQGAGPEAGGYQQQTGPNDDVVDADYKEV